MYMEKMQCTTPNVDTLHYITHHHHHHTTTHITLQPLMSYKVLIMLFILLITGI